MLIIGNSSCWVEDFGNINDYKKRQIQNPNMTKVIMKKRI